LPNYQRLERAEHIRTAFFDHSFSGVLLLMLWPTHRFPPARSEPRFRILYVGNDLDLIAALRGFLTKPDHRVVSCMDCGSAACFLKGDPRYDLLVFDLELGTTRILELIPLVRSLSHREHLPIIVLTEGERDKPERLARNAGADEVLTRKDWVGITQTIARRLRPARNELVVRF
jgi:CheY-like chemotaxis protein